MCSTFISQLLLHADPLALTMLWVLTMAGNIDSIHRHRWTALLTAGLAIQCVALAWWLVRPHTLLVWLNLATCAAFLMGTLLSGTMPAAVLMGANGILHLGMASVACRTLHKQRLPSALAARLDLDLEGTADL